MSLESGIQFGGSNMCIAYSRDDKLSIIVNEAGYRTTPAVLSLTDEEYLVGIPAKQNLIRNSKTTILYTKHFIGKSIESVEIRDFVQRLDCEVKSPRENEIAFVVEDKELSVCDAIDKQLKYLNGKPKTLIFLKTSKPLYRFLNSNYSIDLAKTSLSVKDCNVVLSAPCYFTKEQCEYLK
jgi:molecular chaperone DnaK (HSP70)